MGGGVKITIYLFAYLFVCILAAFTLKLSTNTKPPLLFDNFKKPIWPTSALEPESTCYIAVIANGSDYQCFFFCKANECHSK